MNPLLQRQREAIAAHKAAHPDVDWESNVVVLHVVDWRVPANDHEYQTSHRPKDEMDYFMEEVSCWCCMQRTCACPQEAEGEEMGKHKLKSDRNLSVSWIFIGIGVFLVVAVFGWVCWGPLP